jgi:hypothetical protein
MKQHQVQTGSLLHYSRRYQKAANEKKSLVQQLTEEKRDVMILLNEETREMVLRN